MIQVERATAKDYDALLDFMNDAFGYPADAGFDRFLPVMWKRDDAHMGKHLIIRDGERIVAGLGVYPLPVSIMGEPLLFATCGNVGTRKEYRGRGLMTTLLQAAMAELKAIGADAARLEGKRERYARYGFAHAGLSRQFLFYRSALLSPPCQAYTFTPIAIGDTAALTFASQLQRSEAQFVHRGGNDEFFQISSAWYRRPYLACDAAGKPVGMLSVSENSEEIAEIYAASTEVKAELLRAWIITNNLGKASYPAPGYDTALARILHRDCAALALKHASQFKIMHWDKLARALLKLKFSPAPFPEGSLALHIRGYGTLCYRDGVFEMTDGVQSDWSVDPLIATALLFGYDAPTAVCDIPSDRRILAQTLFPLPLSWNTQDRV